MGYTFGLPDFHFLPDSFGCCGNFPMKRTEVLTRAASLITGDRAAEYGDAKESFRRIAGMWSAYLGWSVSPSDAAMMLALLKASRVSSNPGHDDSYVDGAAYFALAAEVAEKT
jgi:hypothetical protein